MRKNPDVDLARTFWQAAGRAPDGDDGALERALADTHGVGAGAWPRILIAPADWARLLGRRFPSAGVEAAAWVRARLAADLFLACACELGDEAALREIERLGVAPAIARFGDRGYPAAFIDELFQKVRVRLFVAEPGRPARVSGYTGEGSLAGWVRTVVARLVVDMHRAAEPEGDPELAARLRLPRPDPELDHLKVRYGAAFRAAFAEALAALSPKAGTLLQLHYLDGMTIDEMSAMYRTPRRTLQRWIGAARSTVLAHTRRLLTERLAVSTATMDTIMRLVRSQLDLDVRGVLPGRPGAPASSEDKGGGGDDPGR